MYLIIALTFISVFIFFRIVNLLVNYIRLRKKTKHKLSYFLPAMEFVVWNALIIWSFTVLYNRVNTFILAITAALITAFAILFWTLIKDLLFGIYYKSQNKIINDKTLKFKENEGTVVKVGNFSFDLELKTGETESIPYRILNNGTLSFTANNQYQKKIKLFFEFPYDETPEKLMQNLKRILYNSPWVTEIKDIEIISTDKAEDKIKMSAMVYTVSNQFSDKIRDYVYKVIEL